MRISTRVSAALAAGALLTLTACGGGDSTETPPAAETQTEAVAVEETEETETPEPSVELGDQSESAQVLEQYIQALIEGDDEAAVALLAPAPGGALPTDHISALPDRHALEHVTDAVEASGAQSVRVADGSDGYDVHIFASEGDAQSIETLFTFGEGLLNEDNQISMSGTNVSLELPYYADVSLNRTLLEPTSVDEPDVGVLDADEVLHTLHVNGMPVGTYEVTFGDTYIVLDDFEWRVEGLGDVVEDYFGTEGAEQVTLKPEIDEELATLGNTLTQELFTVFNAGDITAASIPGDFDDVTKAAIAESINAMNGMNKGIVSGERIFYPFEVSDRKWFTPIDNETFQIAYEFDYDAGIATNLTNEVIFEVRYDGDGAITPVMVWYERMD